MNIKEYNVLKSLSKFLNTILENKGISRNMNWLNRYNVKENNCLTLQITLHKIILIFKSDKILFTNILPFEVNVLYLF